LKYLISILTFLLLLYGLLALFASLFSTGLGIFTLILTVGTFIGLITSIFNKRVGWTIIFTVIIGWLLRYLEHVSYLLLYDPKNEARWIIVLIPILLSLSIFILIYKARQEKTGRPFRAKFICLTFLALASLALASFLRKTQTQEFNCWYFIEDNQDDFKISFSVTPKHIFEIRSNSKELKTIIKREAITYDFRQGYYCPETKLRIVTQLKEVVGLKIMGFRNTDKNKIIKFDKPFELDLKTLKGDQTILQPNFTLGD